MRKTRIALIIAATLTALIITAGIAFASSAVVDSKTYTHPSRFDNCLVIDGIDVSYWQNSRGNIDWNKVKRQGIDYVFIRIGYTSQSSFNMYEDSYFETNYQGARDAGIMVGVYYYSMATTTSEAQKEAKYVLKLLDGRQLDMPVIMDYEFAGRLTNAYNSWSSSTKKTKLTSNALAFLKVIADSEYEPMFYSYRNMLDNSLTANLIDNKYKVWMAQYSTNNSYSGNYEFWQYTSSGKVTGLSGNIDCNFWYYDNSAEVTEPGTTSIKDCKITLGRTSFPYTKFKKYPTPTVTYNGTKLVKGEDYQVYYIKNVLAGTAYAMIRGIGDYSNTALVPFTITTADIADGGKITNTIQDYTYDGTAKKPAVTVMYTGTTFKKNVDYTVSYSNNVNAGTATITIKGKRNFHGSFTQTFTIKKADPKFTGYTSYSRKVGAADFTINTKCDSGADLTYKSSDTSIATVNQNGKISLKGKAGTVTITVTSPSTKNYNAGTRQVKITVKDNTANEGIINGVENTTIDADIRTGTGYIRLDWTKSASYNMDAFEVFRSTDPDSFGSKAYFTTKSGSSDYYRNTKGLTKGTTYYFKIRGKRVIDGKTYYSKWSDVVSITYGGTSATEPNQGIINGVEKTTIDADIRTGNGFIRLDWEKSAGYNMDAFEIFRSTDPDSFGSKAYFTTKSGSSDYYKNTKGLTKGTTYYFKIRGKRVIDGKTYYSKWSDVVSITYKKQDLNSASQNLINGVKNTTIKASSTAGTGYIRIDWTKSAGYKVDFYEVFRSTDPDSFDDEPYFTTKSGGISNYYKNTKALVKGTRYYYKVRGVREIDGETYYTKWFTLVYRIAK